MRCTSLVSAKPQSCSHANCVIFVCVPVCGCVCLREVEAVLELPSGMLLPGSHLVSEGEVTPNRRTSILSPSPSKPQGHTQSAFSCLRSVNIEVGVSLLYLGCVQGPRPDYQESQTRSHRSGKLIGLKLLPK